MEITSFSGFSDEIQSFVYTSLLLNCIGFVIFILYSKIDIKNRIQLKGRGIMKKDF